MTPDSRAGAALRFRGRAASERSRHLAGASVLAAVVSIAIAGVVLGLPAVVFIAVGAGAGYSLSGSV